MSSSLNRYIEDAMLKQHYYDGGDRTKTEENQNKKSEWEKRLLGHKTVKRTKNIMTKESKGSRQTTKVSFFNQVMMAGFCKQKPKELFSCMALYKTRLRVVFGK